MNPKRSVFFATVAAIIFMIVSNAYGAGLKNEANDALRAVSGFWYTEGHEGGIELYPCNGKVCGRFQWIKKEENTGEASRDPHNPDPALRERDLCHQQFMGDFAPDGDKKNHYSDGWIYSPRDGGTYDAELTLLDHDTLNVRGYLFISLLGGSQNWTRAKAIPSCKKD